jgi:hypothetical protein
MGRSRDVYRYMSALWKGLGWWVTHGEPDNVVRIGGEASATTVLFISEGLDDDWIIQRACNIISVSIPSSHYLQICKLAVSVSTQP